jgi:predicted dehydrogenase
MTKLSNKTTRRKFITQTGMITAGIGLGVNPISAISYNRIIGANDKIRVGFIGVGNRGTQLLRIFMDQPDCEIAALCDVYEPYITRDRSKVDPRYISTRGRQIPQMGETFANKVEKYSDYRKLLENKNIDAVCIATPDHWHALMTIHSIQAGKDVYVEKPLSKTIVEGRAMINAGKNSKQIVSVGLNRRASSNFQKLAKEVPAGKIGKVTFVSSCYVGNMFPDGIGKMKPENPPKDFNWDFWLGPRADRPYQYNMAPYMFRWFNDFSSQIGNQGVHYLDLMRWMTNELAPVVISASGGKYAVNDDRTIPDTLQATYEFASGKLFDMKVLEASDGNFVPYGFIELRGTKGTLLTNDNDYKIIPTKPGQFQTWDKLMDAEEVNLDNKGKLLSDGTSRDSTTNLIRNFLDCIKSRKTPFCTLEDAHRSTSLALLANISLATKQRLQWDPAKELFTNSDEANKLLHYEYRKPWKL